MASCLLCWWTIKNIRSLEQKEGSLLRNSKRKEASRYRTARRYSNMRRYYMRAGNIRVRLMSGQYLILYRMWEVLVFIEGNLDIWAEYPGWIYSLSLLGSPLMWDIALTWKRDCWVHNSQKDEGIHWEKSPRSSPYLLRQHESKGLGPPSDPCVQFY